MQPDVQSDWTTESIDPYLAVASDLGAELAVFPETFPFWRTDSIPNIEEARARLASVTCPSSMAFIAGGLVQSEEGLRNAVFLTHRGASYGTYFKRVLWPTEEVGTAPFPVVPGDHAEILTWVDRVCVPLICADVFTPDAAARQKLFASVRERGAHDGDLIVVCAYAGGPRGPQWRDKLRAWSQEFGSPVAFCNFAGEDSSGDLRDQFGGGGSTVFWPDARRAPPQPASPGVFLHDL